MIELLVTSRILNVYTYPESGNANDLKVRELDTKTFCKMAKYAYLQHKSSSCLLHAGHY